jgi:predicted amidohydrolase
MSSKGDKEANLLKAARLVKEARARGARLVVLPELFNCYDHLEVMTGQAERLPGRTSTFMADLARRLRLYLCGTLLERARANRVYNTALLFGPTGDLLGSYRKVHLFNIHTPGLSFQESQYVFPGKRLTLVEVEGFKAGIAICFDLRFPGLFQRLASRGADLLLLPSAFTATTGKYHWEVLLRARAIENQCYLAAANQFGRHPNGITTFGHSHIIDPWGEIMAEVRNGEGVALATIDKSFLRRVREKLPLHSHFVGRGERREAR